MVRRGVNVNNLLQSTDRATAVTTKFELRKSEGYAFSASKRFEGVSAGSSFDCLFNNPTGSRRTAEIISVIVGGLAQGHIDIYDGVSITSYGSEMIIRNLKLGCGITSACKAYYGGSYDISGASKVHETVLPGGSKVRAVGELSEIGESVIIRSGYNLMVRVTNKSGSSSDFSVRFIWYEEVSA